MNDEYSIVRMQPGHISPLAELEKICFSVPWSENGLRAELFNPQAVFFVAEKNDEILGYCGMHHIFNEISITNIAVFPEHRRRGVAGRLLFEVIHYAIHNGATQITLEVRPSNKAAVAVYEKFGFVNIGVRKNFYTLPEEDAVIMQREISMNN